MGDRGFNAGGFAYMAQVICPRCGASRPLGHAARKVQANHVCPDRKKCDARIKHGRFLHRLKKSEGTK